MLKHRSVHEKIHSLQSEEDKFLSGKNDTLDYRTSGVATVSKVKLASALLYARPFDFFSQ